MAYLQIDTPREEWSQRIGRLTFTEPQPHELFIADMWQVPQFPFDVLDPQKIGMGWLRDQIAAVNPVVTIIDTLREVHGGDENDSTVMRNVIANLVAACRPSAIVLLSHARKDSILTANGDDDMMDQGRGSSYVAGRMDVIIKLTAKRMMFKGRATGQQIEVIRQNEATGLIEIEPSTDDAAMAKLIADVRQALGPKASQRAVCDELAKRTNTSYTTALRRIKAHGGA